MSGTDIGVYGLGTMGSALALNLAEKGFSVSITNLEPDWIDGLVQEAGPLATQLRPERSLEEFVAGLRAPRVVLFMIPSGAPMDQMLAKITPLLDPGDTVIDGGNANFHDTVRRNRDLDAQSLHFVGLGVSGGEDGARHGPSMMMGGSAQSWARVRPMLDAIAAHYNGDPCVARVGPDGAGHFVKTVHNGIEYADMQMMAEIYGVLRDGSGWAASRIGDLFETWRDGPLDSFLIEATARALKSFDTETGQPMVDVIRDAAGQKGTGRWTVIEALQLGQSASTIEAAVGARSWSAGSDTRAAGAQVLPPEAAHVSEVSPTDLESALLAGRVIGHAQGFDILAAASAEKGWNLDLPRIAEIWRAGCIIRSALLNDIASALHAGPPHAALLLSEPMISVL